jgi:hypothetical protein
MQEHQNSKNLVHGQYEKSLKREGKNNNEGQSHLKRDIWQVKSFLCKEHIDCQTHFLKIANFLVPDGGHLKKKIRLP